MISVTWDEPSAEWLRELPHFADRLAPHLQTAVDSTVQTVANMMEDWIPVFERSLLTDLQRRRASKCGPCEVEAFLFFSDATLNDLAENVAGPDGDASAPYSVAAGADEGAKEHRVYLYNREGQSTPGRRKLIRWLRANVPEYAGVPEDADKDWFNHRKKDEHTAPPFVTVWPRATNFWSDWTANQGDNTFNVLVENVYQAIGRVW